MPYFDQGQEELEIEFNSRYDYITEAYAGMQECPIALRHEAEALEEEWQAEQAAFIGPRKPFPSYPRAEGDDIPF